MFVNEFIKSVNTPVEKYSDDQPRDEKGRFSSGGNAGVAKEDAAMNATTKKEHDSAAAYHHQLALESRHTGDKASAKLHDRAARAHETASRHSNDEKPFGSHEPGVELTGAEYYSGEAQSHSYAAFSHKK